MIDCVSVSPLYLYALPGPWTEPGEMGHSNIDYKGDRVSKKCIQTKPQICHDRVDHPNLLPKSFCWEWMAESFTPSKVAFGESGWQKAGTLLWCWRRVHHCRAAAEDPLEYTGAVQPARAAICIAHPVDTPKAQEEEHAQTILLHQVFVRRWASDQSITEWS